MGVEAKAMLANAKDDAITRDRAVKKCIFDRIVLKPGNFNYYFDFNILNLIFLCLYFTLKGLISKFYTP